ncbi:hypothetical protein VULLAG_LOCUS5966 [Vulpes lagopus]
MFGWLWSSGQAWAGEAEQSFHVNRFDSVSGGHLFPVQPISACGFRFLGTLVPVPGQLPEQGRDGHRARIQTVCAANEESTIHGPPRVGPDLIQSRGYL